jgi:hypothetical protein
VPLQVTTDLSETTAFDDMELDVQVEAGAARQPVVLGRP